MGKPVKFRNICYCAVLTGVLVVSAHALPTITSVTRSADTVGKYTKLELAVALTATYTNPYDFDQVDLSATFTSPSSKTWNISGFYDSLLQFRVRFSPNELGTYTYSVTVKDPSGTSQSVTGSFVCKASTYHGWVKIAPNNRYFSYDDGTSFYGVGCCYCWDVTDSGIGVLQSFKMNTWFWWNGTHKTVNGKEQYQGGYKLIESPLGQYDFHQCTYVDSQMTWGEARGLSMWIVIWPHDYLAQTMTGSWVNLWIANSYNTLLPNAKTFYSDSTCWKYQQKMYRYIIARWGYSRALEGWQTVDEIAGTDGYVADKASGNAWMKKMAAFFKANDPYQHPTCASNETPSDSVMTCTNSENYGGTTPANWNSLVTKLWNGWTKPALTGECSSSNDHQNLWSCLASGEAASPFMWQFNQGWTAARSQNYPPFTTFVSDIPFARLTNPSQAQVTVSGATAYGIKSNEAVWGWMTGAFSGKSLSVAGVANGTYTLTWFDCKGGTAISSSSITISGGALTATVPTTSVADIAFKALAPLPVQVVAGDARKSAEYRPIIAYGHGIIRLLSPLATNSVMQIMTAQGRVVAQRKIPDANAAVVPVGSLSEGVYFVKITSGGKNLLQRLTVGY
jgi:hypothetical protein